MSHPSRFSALKYAFEAFWWYAATRPLGLVPSWALRPTAGLLARYSFDLLRFRRRVTLENLRTAFPEKSERERIKIGRACYEHTVYSSAEFMRLTRENALQDPGIRVEVHDKNEIVKRLRETGIVFTLGHLGSWEFLSSYWSARNVPQAILYKPMHNPILNEDFVRRRQQSSNARFISTRLEPRQLWRELKQAADEKRALVFLADQDARRDGIFVPFFGKNASTAAGPATLALRMNLPLVPMACIRTGLWSFRIIFGDAIEPLPGGRTPENVRQLTAMHTQALEDLVRQYPEQYMWFHQRWKSQPRKPKSKGSSPSLPSSAAIGEP